jgi:GTP-binding protein
LTLERAIEFIKSDEMVEVTPRSIRLRKTNLSADKRHRLQVERLNGLGQNQKGP